MSVASNQAAFPSQDANSEVTNNIGPIGAGGATAGQDVKGAMLDPSAANKNWVRSTFSPPFDLLERGITG